ncbi:MULTISPECIES: hypothetical protein [Salinisphaera]|uniref:hypothetical protein n=1 Tax=Salinisphaera TaxID=180541 RepID=UPI000DBEA600
MKTISTQSAGHSGANRDTTPPMLAIVMEGGLVQAVVSDRSEAIRVNVWIIDYDTDGADDDELSEVPQGDGSFCDAVVDHRYLTEAAIDLHHIVDKTDSDP